MQLQRFSYILHRRLTYSFHRIWSGFLHSGQNLAGLTICVQYRLYRFDLTLHLTIAVLVSKLHFKWTFLGVIFDFIQCFNERACSSSTRFPTQSTGHKYSYLLLRPSFIQIYYFLLSSEMIFFCSISNKWTLFGANMAGDYNSCAIKILP